MDLDEFFGGYQATDHLVGKHSIPVHYLGYDAPHGTSRGRYRGWTAAMIDHGFAQYSDYFLRLNLSEDEAVTDYDRCRQNEYEIVRELFKTGSQDKYCVFATGDYTATSVYKAAEDVGLDVGRQVFVVGYHNRPLCERLDPPLSSISWSAEECGYQAASLLYNSMVSKGVQPSLHKVLPVELVVRQSSTGNNGAASFASSGQSLTDEKGPIVQGQLVS